MFRNYLAAALRNLVRNRLYATINIVGLAIGLVAAILIGLFVRDEFSYDNWIPDHEQLYRVSAYAELAGKKYEFDYAPLGAADALKQEFPEIDAITGFVPDVGTKSVRHGDREYMETLYWAKPNLFDVLRLPVVAGDLAAALRDPDGLVLTRAMARKYFGRDVPIGETLEIDRQYSMRVTAVLEDLPSNTHLNFAIIGSGLSSHTPEYFRDVTKPNSAVSIYLRLVPGASADHLRQSLAAFNDRHREFQKAEYPFWLDRVISITDIHLTPGFHVGEMKPAGSAAVASSAALVGLLIVAIACINFVNLATVQSVRRAVEVGVRKTSGAVRRHLIIQFVCESTIYAAFGMVLAVAATAVVMPSFNAFLGRTISSNAIRNPDLIGTAIVITAFIGICSGLYPAVVLAGIAPAQVMKRSSSQGFKGRGKRILVVTQFTILIMLSLVAMAIYRQVHYGMTAALRFQADQVLAITTPCDANFVNGVRALPGVQAAVCSANPMLSGNFPLQMLGPDDTKVDPRGSIVDFDAFELYGLKPVAGRFFSRNFGSDAVPDGSESGVPSSVVINEALSHALGFATPQQAIGHVVHWTPRVRRVVSDITEGSSEIVGVAPNFKPVTPFTIRDAIAPEVFWVDPVAFNTLNVKLTGRQTPETLAAIDNLWKRIGPPRPINRAFLDQSINDIYREFTRLSRTMGIFTAVAVLIAGLGLFGMAAFTVEQRTKEIGVRKALGASSRDILRLMLWEFSLPVLWASIVAWPLAYFVMRNWLEGFADRVDIGWWTFPAASAVSLAIAMVTVFGHALVAARAEPITALRYE